MDRLCESCESGPPFDLSHRSLDRPSFRIFSVEPVLQGFFREKKYKFLRQLIKDNLFRWFFNLEAHDNSLCCMYLHFIENL